MYERHPVFDEPEEETVLWRYMSFAKFVSLLSRQELYFCRVDQLEDLYEGRLPKKTHDITDPWLRAGYEGVRSSTIVNCWTASDRESVALWKTYVPSGCEGVAVRSTFARLRDSFRKEGLFENAHLHIGRVRYIDFNEADFVGEDRTAFNALIPLLNKRHFFEYEHEVRAVITNGVFLGPIIRQTRGLYVPVALPALIEYVHVAPEAEKWVVDTVKVAMQEHGLEAGQVVQSDLDAPPPGSEEDS